MNTSNFPETPNDDYQPARKSGGKNAAILVLGIAFLGSLGYAVSSGNKAATAVQQNQTQIAKVGDEKSAIQKSFDESLVRLDSMSGMANSLRSNLAAKNTEIDKRKKEIRSILNKKNASAAELAKAKDLINQLNDKISTMEEDVARLTQDNQNLNQEKVVLTQDKDKLTTDLSTTTAAKEDLEKKVDVASTLNATNIAITPVDVKSNGKEKVTTTAKRVNKLIISFDVNNRIAQAGSTDVYVCIIGPDGKNITSSATASGTFTSREEGDKTYTAKLPVEFETGKSKNVQFAFTPGANFQQGSYTIQIYQNGFKIGEGVRELKKGGLFS
jgi:myosin heavy subunit